MSDALEALNKLVNLAHYDGDEQEDFGDEGDFSRLVHALSNTIRAALEQGEAKPVAWLWEHYGAHVTTSYDRAQQLIADGCYLQPLYTAQPSTAEAQARALSLVAMIGDIARVAGDCVPDAIDNDGQPYQSQSLAEVIAEAKRIREEG